jgi:hypothetical protein
MKIVPNNLYWQINGFFLSYIQFASFWLRRVYRFFYVCSRIWAIGCTQRLLIGRSSKVMSSLLLGSIFSGPRLENLTHYLLPIAVPVLQGERLRARTGRKHHPKRHWRHLFADLPKYQKVYCRYLMVYEDMYCEQFHVSVPVYVHTCL